MAQMTVNRCLGLGLETLMHLESRWWLELGCAVTCPGRSGGDVATCVSIGVGGVGGRRSNPIVNK
jgi:hypothetical protein